MTNIPESFSIKLNDSEQSRIYDNEKNKYSFPATHHQDEDEIIYTLNEDQSYEADIYYEIECQDSYVNYETTDQGFNCTVNVGKTKSSTNVNNSVDFVIFDSYGFPLKGAEILVKENYFDNNSNDDIRTLGTINSDGAFVWENPTFGKHNFLLVDTFGNSYYFKLEISEVVVKVIISIKEDSF